MSSSQKILAVDLGFLTNISIFFSTLITKYPKSLSTKVNFTEEVIRSILFVAEKCLYSSQLQFQLELEKLYSLPLLIQMTEFAYLYLSNSNLKLLLNNFFTKLFLGMVKEIPLLLDTVVLLNTNPNIYPEIKQNTQSIIELLKSRPKTEIVQKLCEIWGLNDLQKRLFFNLTNETSWEGDFKYLLYRSQKDKMKLIQENTLLPSGKKVREFVLTTFSDYKTEMEQKRMEKTLNNNNNNKDGLIDIPSPSLLRLQWILDLVSHSPRFYRLPSDKRCADILYRFNNVIGKE